MNHPFSVHFATLLFTFTAAYAQLVHGEDIPSRTVVCLDAEPLVAANRLLEGDISAPWHEELVRQAVLIAGRDEVGCVTRDAWLSESPDDAEAAFRLGLRWSPGRPAERSPPMIFTFTGSGGKAISTWSCNAQTGSSELDSPKFLDLVTQLDAETRISFPELLRRAGVTGAPNKWSDDAAVPEAVKTLLNQPDFVSQFEAVRGLHRLIRDDAESPQRLAALVEGYVHLACLTECCFHPVHEILDARAILYAYRLAAKRRPFGPLGDYGLGLRFATLVLVGRHRDAEQLGRCGLGSQGAKAAPGWMAMAVPHLEYKVDALLELDKQGDLGPWPAIFAYRTLLYAGRHDEAAQMLDKLLARHPHCQRLRTEPLMLPVPKLLPSQDRAVEDIGPWLNERLTAVQGMPADLCQRGENEAQHDDFSARAQLVADLLKPSNTNDAGRGNEFSLPVLGTLTREMLFAQIVWRSFFLRGNWPTAGEHPPINTWLDQAGPLIRLHPYGGLLTTYRTDARLQTALDTLPDGEAQLRIYFHRLTRSDFPLLQFVLTVDGPKSSAVRNVLRRQLIETQETGDVHATYRKAVFTYLQNSREKAAASMLAVSPYNPWGLATLSKPDSLETLDFVEQHWDCFNDCPEVQTAFLRAMLDLGRYEEVIERIETHGNPVPAKLLPLLGRAYAVVGPASRYEGVIDTVAASDQLTDNEKLSAIIDAAERSLAAGRLEQAKRLLSACGRAQGVDGAMVRSMLLELDGRFTEATDCFADRAAQFGGLDALFWYWACLRTGSPNSPRAAALLRAAFQPLADHPTFENRNLWRNMSVAMLTLDEPTSAIRDRYRGEFQNRAGSFYGMHAVMLLWKGNNRDPAKQYLAKVADNPDPQAPVEPHYARLAKCLLADLEADAHGKSLSDETIESSLRLAPIAGERINVLYFLGVYFDLQGDEDRAVDCWRRAVSIPLLRRSSRTLAVYELRKRGMTDQEYLGLTRSTFGSTSHAKEDRQSSTP